MPATISFGCPQCGAVAEGTLPLEWIHITTRGGTEYCDRWECVVEYATAQQQVAATVLEDHEAH